MDNNNILNDENLDKLNFIKKIDTYSIVDKEFDKKRNTKKVWMVIEVSVFVILIAILGLILSKGFIDKLILNKSFLDKVILRGILGYYILSIWTLMLLIVPIIKKKRISLN